MTYSSASPHIIIQARIGSSRLPGKVLLEYNGKTLLEHLLTRLVYAELPIILAVPENDLEKFEHLTGSFPIKLFGGSEEDVLERYYKAASKYKADQIIRVTADNPFTSVDCLKLVLKKHIESKSDLSHPLELPYGSGVEVISFPALEKCHKEARDPFEREHITQYIYRNLDKFSLTKFLVPEEYRCEKLRLTVDTTEDADFFKKILRDVPPKDGYIRLPEIIKQYGN